MSQSLRKGKLRGLQSLGQVEIIQQRVVGKAVAENDGLKAGRFWPTAALAQSTVYSPKASEAAASQQPISGDLIAKNDGVLILMARNRARHTL